MNPQNYTINIRPGWGISQVVKVSQGDVGRPLAFTIMDGQDALTIASGTTVTIKGTKPSTLGFTQACELSGNTASVETTATMTQEAGAVQAELILTQGTTIIGSANFVMYVEPAAHPEGTTDGDAETARDLMTRAEQAVAQAEAAAESISQAGIDTTGSTAGQVPTSNGNGSWSWQTPQAGGGGTSDDITNASSVSGSTVSDALDTLSDEIASEETTRSEADASLRAAIDALVSPSGQSVVVDSSLSISGAAADAKVTGDRLAEIGDGIADASLIDDGAIGAEKLSADVAEALNPIKLDVLYLYGDESEIQTKWQNRDKSKMNFRYVFHNINENKQKNGWCKLSLQGNATLGYPKHNFNIQFYKDAGYTTKDKVDFMDLTDDKHPKWTLKANYNDYSQGRNVVSARLWGDVVHCRPNMSKALSDAPNHGAIDGHPVIIMMNDTYYGLYMFNMSKSDWMLGIDEDNPMHCAVSSNLATDSTKWLSTGLGGWELEIPDEWQTVDIEGVSTSVQAGFLALQSFVINSTDADFYASLGDYLDVNSAIDYLIYSFCVCNADSMNKNQFLVTWDAGKTWTFTAYDMDQTFGAGFTAEIPYNHDLFSTHPNHLFERLIANFYDEIMERYNVLRSSVFSYNYVARELLMFFNEIPSGEREKDKALYPGIMFQNISTLSAMQEFAQNRLAWCDTYFARLDPDYVACTGITLNKSSISFTEVDDTDTLIATVTPNNCSDHVVWSSSNANVATVSNGLVTAMGDGSCTITATCGDYSATANISVEIDTSIVYRFPSNLKGTVLVDEWNSGEAIFDQDKTITVVLDCAGTNVGANGILLKLATEFRIRPYSNSFDLIFGGKDGMAKDGSNNNVEYKGSTIIGNSMTNAYPYKLVITHAIGEQTASIYVKNYNGIKGSAVVTKNASNTQWYGNSNLLVSQYGNRYVLNDLLVYNRVLSQTEIDAFLDS